MRRVLACAIGLAAAVVATAQPVDAQSVGELARVGRDVECVALARAVRWHVEHRVLLNGRRTIVFR